MFKKSDYFGKAITSNAALLKGMDALKTDKGMVAFFDKYVSVFGEKWVNEVLYDLTRMEALPMNQRHQRVTPAIIEYAMMELADAQPISQMQIPMMRLEHPRTSLTLALLSYVNKKADLFRTHIYNQVGLGNYKQAAKDFTRFSIYIGGSATATDMARSWLTGRTVETSNWLRQWAFQMSDTVYYSEYLHDGIAQGRKDIQDISDPLTKAPTLGFLSLLIVASIQSGMVYLDFGKPDDRDERRRERDNLARTEMQLLKKIPLIGGVIHNPFNPNTAANERAAEKAKRRNSGLGGF